MFLKTPLFLALVVLMANSSQAETLAYIGTYTRGESEGIYLSTLDLQSGNLSQPVLAAQADNPSFLVIHPNGQYLYAVSEVASFQGKPSGAVSAFSIDSDGTLTLLNQQSSGGGHPCHIAIDSTGSCLLVANYSGGNCSSYPIGEDGTIGALGSIMQHEGSSVDPRRQKGPHAHSINVDPSNRRAFSADLGLDKILIYDLDSAKGSLQPAKQPYLKTPPGGGPRHLSFHPSGRFAFANLEMTLNVAAISYERESGAMKMLGTYPTVAEGTPQKGNSTAEALVHPSGKFLYVSNRGPNTIAAFRINESNGELTPIERESTGGEIPRGFGIDPSGRFLVVGNQRSHNLIVLEIDPDTGALKPTGSEIKVDSPVNVRFLVR